MTQYSVLPRFSREHASKLTARLQEPRRYIQIVTGPRQVGKTTLVQQVLVGCRKPTLYVSADEPAFKDSTWLRAQWEAARLAAADSRNGGAVLTIDEVQKISGWSESVKALWDEDSISGIELHIVLLGSSPLLIQSGVSESLAGRFERIALPHWSFAEMRSAFNYSLEQYLFFGGFPGAAPLVKDFQRWQRYMMDSLIETTISRDVLLHRRVDKPALLRRLFELGCHYSGQILSYNKMLGQLQDAGNATTLAHYLDLLSGIGMVTGLGKYAGDAARRRGSSPKLQVYNTALLTAVSGITPAAASNDREFWGRLTESAVGAYLANAALSGECDVFYWRDRNREVDFVVKRHDRLVAIEVKSGRKRTALRGLSVFEQKYQPHRVLLVGADGIPLENFLSKPVSYWLS